MNIDMAALRHFGVDGEPLDEARVQVKNPRHSRGLPEPRATH